MPVTLEQRQARARRRLYIASAFVLAMSLLPEFFPAQFAALMEGIRAGMGR